MSMVPIGSAMGPEDPFSGSEGWRARYGAEEISQFRAADLIASKWGITRPEMECYALASHQRAVRAIDHGAFEAEIVPYGAVSQDEGPRRDTTLDKMAALEPLRDGGRITAALSSQIADAISRAAPSELWLASAAVLVPPGRRGASAAIVSTVVSRRGPSSCVTSP